MTLRVHAVVFKSSNLKPQLVFVSPFTPWSCLLGGRQRTRLLDVCFRLSKADHYLLDCPTIESKLNLFLRKTYKTDTYARALSGQSHLLLGWHFWEMHWLKSLKQLNYCYSHCISQLHIHRSRRHCDHNIFGLFFRWPTISFRLIYASQHALSVLQPPLWNPNQVKFSSFLASLSIRSFPFFSAMLTQISPVGKRLRSPVQNLNRKLIHSFPSFLDRLSCLVSIHRALWEQALVFTELFWLYMGKAIAQIVCFLTVSTSRVLQCWGNK